MKKGKCRENGLPMKAQLIAASAILLVAGAACAQPQGESELRGLQGLGRRG